MMKRIDRAEEGTGGGVGETVHRARVGVLGTFVWDTIRHPAGGGGVVEQLGGIAYSLAAFPAALAPGWEIVPLVRVGSDLAEVARDFLTNLPRIASEEGVRVTPHPNNRVELSYTGGAERTERLTGGVPPWEEDELRDAIDGLDALYINFIAGNEIDLATATSLGTTFDGPIYADLHSLFLGEASKTGPRPPRPLPDAARWLRCFDVIQLNQAELGLLNVHGDEEYAFLHELLAAGPRMVCVTRGGKGARIAYRDASGARGGSVHDIAIPGGPRAGDPTGCGDIWGSVLCAALLAGLDPHAAAARANRAAAARLGARSIEELAGRIEQAIEAGR